MGSAYLHDMNGFRAYILYFPDEFSGDIRVAVFFCVFDGYTPVISLSDDLWTNGFL